MDLVKWESDSVYVDLSDCYATSFELSTKKEGLHHFDASQTNGLRQIIQIPARISLIERAPSKNWYFFRWMTVSRYPELELWNDQYQPQAILSVTNPQQANYNWATSEIVKWKAYDGQQLEGILYKPADYDATKKYPLILYYYELNSDNVHNYQGPRPSASTINPTEYASAGYFVFIPDIRYEIGHPAKSAYNCIMSATDYLIKHFPIDSIRMGLQGQSWGGYQTAQLVTMTKRYAAAMAGAPVGNMISAYGGIRWGSGLNRQFQYESTQSRIGKTIWDAQALYIENSPLFHLPNVTTPLLIMANDRDGAVPWYQGLELYNGMRRLGKPCWMLNYNDDDHNLTKLPYKFDLSIRMRQFFDHYLQGKPAPLWLTEGIPAIDKGQKFGYELE
jgi:dipeptidyl aminopeptidase/acylaminoacyl peptidase